MSISLVEREYNKLLEAQMRHATGMRLEQFKKQGEGERKLLIDIFWPVRKTFEGIILENGIVTLTGVKAYIDAYDGSFRFGFEGEGFVPHAENITRSRFDFEKQKVRSMAAHGIKYIPFTWDDMDKKPDMCRRAMYELYGRYGGNAGAAAYQQVSLYEREVIRYALWLGRPFKMSNDFSSRTLRKLIDKKLISPMNVNAKRHHEYVH
jgi:hypothetical protein